MKLLLITVRTRIIRILCKH